VVPQGVVDRLEVIHIHKEHRQTVPLVCGRLKGLLKQLIKLQRVGQPGEAVGGGRLFKQSLGLPKFGDVCEDDHAALGCTGFVPHDADGGEAVVALASLAGKRCCTSPESAPHEMLDDFFLDLGRFHPSVQLSGVLPHDFAAQKPRHALEGRVDIGDHAVVVGHQNALQRILHGQLGWPQLRHQPPLLIARALQTQARVGDVSRHRGTAGCRLWKIGRLLG